MLDSDCLSLILSKVSYVDNLSFRLTSKNNKSISLPNFKDIFIKRLLKHHIVPSYENALLFCDNLYATGAYVAGSFILDCLYDTNYHQDIDIYDQTNLVGSINEENLMNNRFYKFGDGNLRFTQSLYELGFKSIGSNSGKNLTLRYFLHKTYENFDKHIIMKYDNQEQFLKTINEKIQIIPISLTHFGNERSFIPRFISASFDLEICQNTFNGEKLNIKNLDKLIYKYDFIKPNTRFMLAIYPHNFNEHKNTLTETRMKKYIERGFNIKPHPDYDEIDNFIKNILKSNKYSNNIKYIDNGEIDLSKYDY